MRGDECLVGWYGWYGWVDGTVRVRRVSQTDDLAMCGADDKGGVN